MSGKGTSMKTALEHWEQKTKQKAEDALVVKLLCQMPPIPRMDNTLQRLVNCEQLSLSTNSIDKICGLAGLRKLKILSLGRNIIKSFAGLEAVGDVLEQLWISYNNIEKMKGVNVLKKLKVLFMAHNQVKEMGEVSHLNELPCLKELIMVGNPIEEAMSMNDTWRDQVTKALPKLEKLDGSVVLRKDPSTM